MVVCLTPYAWWNNCSLTRISFSHIYCTPDLYPFKDLISISYFMFARAYFLESENYTKNANFFFYWSCKIVNCLIAISLYRYCALYWPIVILVNPLYFLFLWPDFVIALYIVVLFRMQKPLERISRIVDAVKKLSSNQFPRLFQALYIALYKGHLHIINLRSTDTSLVAPRAWASSLKNAR